MSPRRQLFIALLVLLALAACATPQANTPTVNDASVQEERRKQMEMVVEDYMQSWRRLQAVAARVVVNGRELCGTNVAPYYGMTTWSQESFAKEWRAIVAARFGIGEVPSIASIAPGSVADKAGLREGDVIRSINEWTPPTGKDALAKLDEKLASEGKYGRVDFVVQRGAEEIALEVMPETACDFGVGLSLNDAKNAYADGRRIVIYKGMMDFFRSDEELALVVSHELAHNAMHHIDAQKTNSNIGGLVGLLLDVAAAFGGVNTNGNFSRAGGSIGAGAHSVEFEKEADYVGLYFMARAGYDITGAPNFWRRMATANTQAITMKSTHPTTPERFVGLEAAVTEVKQKIERGDSLKPELKNSTQPQTAETPASP
ncbi:MAG: M48 family metalloprotease [Methylobacillus sp.]|jgi:predicted Zn-dependent protease with MMP-like domain|nr:M48 family metalloprotease [Methylobacillus sp.]